MIIHMMNKSTKTLLKVLSCKRDILILVHYVLGSHFCVDLHQAANQIINPPSVTMFQGITFECNCRFSQLRRSRFHVQQLAIGWYNCGKFGKGPGSHQQPEAVLRKTLRPRYCFTSFDSIPELLNLLLLLILLSSVYDLVT